MKSENLDEQLSELLYLVCLEHNQVCPRVLYTVQDTIVLKIDI